MAAGTSGSPSSLPSTTGAVPIRDSKRAADGPRLPVRTEAFSSFVEGVGTGESRRSGRPTRPCYEAAPPLPRGGGRRTRTTKALPLRPGPCA
ncbi:DUF397 domain-containing protein [Streptomyces sp. SAS_281]|uniref:DUF397 domain-containing protein n=1 Tax=Streptomyces sp. SAS_281 TaxID=3412744 RepID=UPI00403C90CD